jgi:CheY-like chemotaxis protein
MFHVSHFMLEEATHNMTTDLLPSAPMRRLVLVADDDPAIQGLVARIIQRIGLIAVPVGDGVAAVAAVQKQRGNLACAILDVVMPVLNGVDAAHTIQQIAPELAIVLMSGAIPAHYTERIRRLRLAGMLSKPFHGPTLRALICHAIDSDGISRLASA